MASGDFAQRAGFTEVFPISTRAIGHNILWLSDVYPPGPPAGLPSANVAVGQYVDDLGLPLGGNDYEAGFVTYLDRHDIIFASRNNVGGAGQIYRIRTGTVWYDLTGLPSRSFSRAEFVCQPAIASGFGEPADADGRSLVGQWHSTITPYEIEAFSVYADFTDEAPTSLALAPILLADIVAYDENHGGNGIPPAQFRDQHPLPPEIGMPNRWVIPITNSAPLRSAARIALRFHISGGIPAGENSAFFQSFYSELDGEAWGTTLSENAGRLPHLRLYGGAVELPRAHGVIQVSGSGQVQAVVEREIVEHRARTERNRVGQPGAVTRRRT